MKVKLEDLDALEEVIGEALEAGRQAGYDEGFSAGYDYAKTGQPKPSSS